MKTRDFEGLINEIKSYIERGSIIRIIDQRKRREIEVSYRRALVMINKIIAKYEEDKCIYSGIESMNRFLNCEQISLSIRRAASDMLEEHEDLMQMSAYIANQDD